MYGRLHLIAAAPVRLAGLGPGESPYVTSVSGDGSVNGSPMTHDAPDRDISTEAEFESALQAMLRTAVENGLDP